MMNRGGGLKVAFCSFLMLTLFSGVLLAQTLPASTQKTSKPATNTTQPASPPKATVDTTKTTTTTNATKSAAPAAVFTPVAQVVWVKGKVEAISSDKKSRILARRDVVYLQDTIKTDKTSTGQLVFSDGGLLSLGVNTTMQMSEYHFNAVDTKDNKQVLDLVKGGFRSITGAITKTRPQNYKVKTPVATIGVRGTIIRADLNQDTLELSVGVESGHAFLVNATGEVALTPNTDHAYATVNSQNEAPSVSETIPESLTTSLHIEPANPDPAVFKETETAPVETNQPSTTETSKTDQDSSSSATETPSTDASTPADTSTTQSKTDGEETSTNTETDDKATTDGSEPVTDSGATTSSSSVEVGTQPDTSTSTPTEVTAPKPSAPTNTGTTSGNICIY